MAKPSKKIQSGSTDKVTRTGGLRQPVKKVPLPLDDELAVDDELDLDDEVDDTATDDTADDDTTGSASGTAARKAAKAGSAPSGKAGKGDKDKTGPAAQAGKKGGVRKVDVKKKPGAKPESKHTSKRVTPAASTRYTPPTAKYEDMPSPIWVPIIMFTLFILGMLAIFLNYVGLLPGATSNWYLLLGLGFILAGIITATQYR